MKNKKKRNKQKQCSSQGWWVGEVEWAYAQVWIAPSTFNNQSSGPLSFPDFYKPSTAVLLYFSTSNAWM